MALTAGTRLGPYEILSPLGSGGMGEVYRARDTRLGRDVAIKVLPQHLSSSPEVRHRFEREAKTISQLSHPHICALYDVGNHDGVEFLVMEYLEGQTLAERLARGPLPLDQTLRYGSEIAGALDKAHRQGIVHRDLKPGNVMITKSGVKLLDFGLAKAVAPVVSPSAVTSLPTAAGSPSLTQEGTILGTIQYMAPEQLEGTEADVRTDIFAFGAMLYEMATGRKAFSGASQASLISAIMKEEPAPIASIAPMSPPALDRVVRTCLAKDPEDRWQSALDVAKELKWTAERSHEAVPASRSARALTLAWTTAALALAGLAFGVFKWSGRPRAVKEASIVRFSILPPAGATPRGSIAVSPDGRAIAFTASDAELTRRVYVRSLDSEVSKPLSGTEGATGKIFWSPDGRFIGFLALDKLKKIAISGGPPVTICDASARSEGGTWSPSDEILFTPDARHGGLARVPAAGGVPAPLTKLDAARHEQAHLFPQMLPDGHHFLFSAVSAPSPNSGVWVGTLDSEETKVLLTSESAIFAPPNHLLFLREGSLMAQRFDPARLELKGGPVPLGEWVMSPGGPTIASAARAGPLFVAAAPGVIVWRNVGGVASQLLWFDRSGKQVGAVNPPDPFRDLALSPDGKRVAANRFDRPTGIWELSMLDLQRGIASRLTFGEASDYLPVWSPDGTRVAYASERGGVFQLYQKRADGSGAEEALLTNERSKEPMDWSSDGRYIVYEETGPKTRRDLWILPMLGDRKPFAYVRTSADEFQGQFSPNGQWMAYVSDESGRWEIYVQPFPATGAKWQVSTAGGTQPRWRADGKELFYLALDRKIMSVDVTAGATFQPGSVKPLFQTHVTPMQGVGTDEFVPTPDGKRFLISTITSGTGRLSSISVLLNWREESVR